MFLTTEDYKPVCSIEELEVLQQDDINSRVRAEKAAFSEIASYISNRYDTETIFKQEGDERDAFLVHVCVSIVLFYLAQWLPNRMSLETRETQYANAIEWLKRVQAGKATPNLPLIGSDTNGITIYSGSLKKCKYDY